MRILFIGHEAKRTGAPLVLIDVIKWFAKEKHDCDLLLLNGGELENEYSLVCKNIYLAKHRSLVERGLDKVLSRDPSIATVKKIYRRLKHKNYDMIYANTVVSLSVAAELKKKMHVKTVLHVHELEYAISIQAGLDSFNRKSKSIDLFVAVSNAVKNNLVSNFSLTPNSIKVLYPFPKAIKLSLGDNIQSELDISDKTFVIGGAGQMSWTKGVDIFMLIAKEFSKRAKTNDYKFVWVGGFPLTQRENEQFKTELKKLEIPNIYFTGHVNNTFDYFKYFSVFLMTSKEESLSLVAMESAMLKKPTVYFENSGGANEWIDQDCGVKVPFCDVSRTVDELLRLYDNPSERERLGNNAFSKVNRNFNEEKFGEELKKILKIEKSEQVEQ